MNVRDLLSSDEEVPMCPPSPATSTISCSSESSDSSAFETPKRGWVAPFLLHLHQMLRRENTKIIRWAEDGMAFQILDKEALTNQILPKYFKNKNFSSFQRQLNYFGFRKWSKARSQFPTYSREHFARDNYSEMSLVKRQSKKSRKRKNSSASEEEQPTKRTVIPSSYVANESCKPILPRPGASVESSPAPVQYQPSHMPRVMSPPMNPMVFGIPVLSPARKMHNGFKLPSIHELSLSSTQSFSAIGPIRTRYPRLVTTQRGPEYEPKDDEQVMTPLGKIPQVPHTHAYFDQDYGIMNEVQLSIGESTCGARTVGWSKDAGPHGYNLFGIAELSKVAMERCDSARCAVQTMGDLAVQYGFYSEDSGDPAKPDYVSSAEALGVADRYGEVWIFHVLTGPQNASAVWAAQRVLDTHVTVVANGFVIREMDLTDPDHFLASENVHSFAKEMGWWEPKLGKPFDFTAAYAAPTPDPVRVLYMGRRIWRVYDLVAPSLKLDSRLGHYPEYPTYPFSVQPDRKLGVVDVTNLLRDYFQGTPYDLSKGLAAGPFGMPMRWGVLCCRPGPTFPTM
ncbi:hypothetical protein BBJ29_000089 [Phytophthora kernoviae]|uniref:HSF-type DNA-binding domain-containing protein n=1 Tax=Phytophthora kernoviae TaxID=325452 RepID=A0A3F2S2R1_9STRA|nr:hypothetical protein BBJ29_000089 [Phytophthora kernoviae]RLN68425.1 hypothetical protein BBP00_00001034 [Phytophthora kernoviae]